MTWLDNLIAWLSPETGYRRDAFRRAKEAERNYDAELMARGIRKENIRHLGFAFWGKKVLIEQE